MPLITPHPYRRNIHTPPSLDDRVANAISAYNMSIYEGQLVDVAGGGNHGTQNGIVIGARTPWGERCLDFDGSTGYIDCGASANLNFTTQTFGGWAWVNMQEVLAPGNFLLSRGNSLNDGWNVVYHAGSTAFSFYTSQPGANQQVYSNISPAANRWYLVGFLSVAGGNNYVYVNGVDDSSAVVARTNPTSAAWNFTIGGHSATVGGGLKHAGKMAAPVIGVFPSKAAYDAQILAERNRVYRIVTYHETLEPTPITFGTYGAGEPISGTDFEVVNGTWSVGVETINGRLAKNFVNATAGNIITQMPSEDSAFGSWEFWMKRTGAEVAQVNISQAKASAGSSSQFGYYLGFSAAQTPQLGRRDAGVGTTIWTGSVGSIDTSWHKWRLTRSTEGVFRVYIDDVYLGTATDTNHNNLPFLHPSSSGGTKFALVKKQFGVVAP